MQEIKCPNCGAVFAVDETNYNKILKQVHDKEFEAALKAREKALEASKSQEIEMVKLVKAAELKEKLNAKETEIALKEKEITKLNAAFALKEQENKLAIKESINQKETEKRQALAALQTDLNAKDKEIGALKAKLNLAELEKKEAIGSALKVKEEELNQKNVLIAQLSGEMDKVRLQKDLTAQNLKDSYEKVIKLKDEQIEYYKDFKIRQSTKMVGESLEQHCLTQFNTLRSTAFPKAYFEKDNDIRTGSKGDFIYREFGEDKTEFISIMFEMKNEMDTTQSKHKNEDFFKELDKDRKEKNCEYAVLVSLLESDNEYYNNGIVDVYQYPKMYVIRPQFFIPIITLLRNAALNSLAYRQELTSLKNQQFDFSNFEGNLNAFKEGFAKNYELASKKYNNAIEEIDKTIDLLNKVKENLSSSANNLRLANKKAEELTIKRLTKNAPTVREKFAELKK